MKKIFSIISILIILFINFWNKSYAVNDKSSPYSLKADFWLYKERVKNICDQYKTKKELLKIEDTYEEFSESYDLDEIIEKHVTDMNDIYKCALIWVQKKSLLLIKNDLTKKNPVLLETIWKKIDSKISKLEVTSKSMKCNNSDDKSSIIKLNVLQQSTYETCKYIAYLEYLRRYNDQISALTKNKNSSYTNNELLTQYDDNINKIDEEIEHTYKVFPMAFHALSEYENNISIHFLLELIKDDYLILREKLNDVLNPINQVVYKISNAMRK